jgi:hypothetical protein
MSTSPEDLIRELETSGVLESSSRTVAAPPAARAPARGGAGVTHRSRALLGSRLGLLLAAALLVALVGSLPFGSLALYPFTLFVTLTHECGHAVAAVASGGRVVEVQLSPDTSGLTQLSGGVQALIAPAGYLGATLAGVALLLTPLRLARLALGALALLPLAVLIVFNPANFFTAAWCVGFAAALVLAAWKAPPRLAAFLQLFLGVEAGLNAFRDLVVLMVLTGDNAHIHTDAVAMSNALFLPPLFWAVLWTALSLLLLLGTVWRLVRRELRLARP